MARLLLASPRALKAALYGTMPTVYDGTLALTGGRKHATATVTADPPCLIVDTGVSVSGVRVVEQYECYQSDPFGTGGLTAWYFAHEVSAFVTSLVTTATTNADTVLGICLGSVGVASTTTLFPHAAALTDLNFIQLRINRKDQVFELVVGKGDSTTGVSITVLTGVAAYADLTCYHLRIVYTPPTAADTGGRVEAYVNGVRGALVTSGVPTITPSTYTDAATKVPRGGYIVQVPSVGGGGLQNKAAISHLQCSSWGVA